MKQFVARIIIIAVAFPVFNSLAFAGLSEKYQGWVKSPEAFLMTKAELKEWKTLTTDQEAEHFIDLFWARRNPHPESAFNSFKAKFDSMVKYCDENFAYEGKRGALSDRGKVFLLMGPPHYKERRAPTQTVTVAATAAGQDDRGTDEARANVVMWVYDPARMLPAFSAKGSRIVFTFYENRPESNDFVQDRSHREATIALRMLRKAPEVYLLHPELETIPKPISVPGGTPATPAQLAGIENASEGALDGKLLFMQDLGVADAAHRPLWIQIALPKGEPVIERFAGRVLDSSAEKVLSTFQIEAKAIEVGEQNIYHLTFPLAAGNFHYEFGAFIKDQVLFVHKAEAEIPESPEGTWFSPVWAGLDARQETDAMLGQAYTFGVWHLMPLSTEKAPKSGTLSYFGYVIHPKIEEGSKPTAHLKLTLRKENGKRLGKPASLNLPMVEVTEGVYMYANAINLGALPTGKCTLEFKISESGVEGSQERAFDLEIVE